MTRADQVWVDSAGERWYSTSSIASLLGINTAEVRKLVQAGLIPPGQPRGGGNTLRWAEHVIVQLQRLARAGGLVQPYR
jgi:hypothetical protein